jgi:hypothetical protein
LRSPDPWEIDAVLAVRDEIGLLTTQDAAEQDLRLASRQAGFEQ